MRAFITGASGFIGSHLLNELLARDWEVRVTIHKHGFPQAPGLETVRAGLTDLDGLKRSMEKTDAVFHLASALGSALIAEHEFEEVNAAGTDSVLRAARESGVKTIIHFSSAGVLGDVEAGRPVDESYPPRPVDAYDRSKLEGERIAREYAARGLDVRVIRPGWVYGPGDKRTLKIIRAVARKRLAMVTKGEALQSPVYVDDLVAGTLRCLEKGRRGEIYHLAGKETLAVRDMVRGIAAAAGVHPPRLRLPLGPARTAAVVLDRLYRLFGKEAPLTPSRLAFFTRSKPLAIGKAVKELGYKPKTSFAEGMAKTIAWYREQGWI